MKRVLVTGANGLLGSNLIRELVARNFFVRALVRTNASVQTLTDLDIEIWTGTLSNKDDLRNAVHGCNYVVHAAAQTFMWPTTLFPLEKVNVAVVKHLIEVCAEEGIERLVYVSTANTIESGTEEMPGNEKNGFPNLFWKSGYALSKRWAESLVLEAVEKKLIDAIIVNPTFLLGPYDSKPSSGRLLLMMYKKKILFVPSGGKNLIDVRDASIAICNALTHANPGERYLLCGQSLSYFEIAQRINISRNVRILILPNFIVNFAGKIGSLLAFFGFKTNLNSPNSKILCTSFFYSNDKARNELKLPVTPIETTINDTLQWFKANGYLE